MKQKLTQKLIESFTAKAGKLTYYWDSGLPGFGVRVTRAGAKAYIVRYRPRAKAAGARRPQRITTISRVGVFTLEEARQRAIKILAAVVDGHDPAAEVVENLDRPTVRDLAAKYMAEHAPRKKARSAKNDEALWNIHIVPLLGDVAIADVDESHVLQLQNKFLKQPATGNRAKALFSKALNLAETWKLRPRNSNPCGQIKRLKEGKRERILDAEEIAAFQARLDTVRAEKLEGWEYVDLLKLLFITGCRRDEWRAGRWEWINEKEKTYNLPDSKTGAKTVYLSDAALRFLHGMAGPGGVPKSGWIFPDPGNRNRALPWEWRKWDAMRRAAGLEGFRVHDIRHTVGSLAHASGLSQKQVAGLLGHARIETAGRYIHDSDRAGAANIAADAMEKAGKNGLGQ